jgi:hypothetical protein
LFSNPFTADYAGGRRPSLFDPRNPWSNLAGSSHWQILGGGDPDRREEKGTQNRDGSHSRVRRGGGWPENG